MLQATDQHERPQVERLTVGTCNIQSDWKYLYKILSKQFHSDKKKNSIETNPCIPVSESASRSVYSTQSFMSRLCRPCVSSLRRYILQTYDKPPNLVRQLSEQTVPKILKPERLVFLAQLSRQLKINKLDRTYNSVKQLNFEQYIHGTRLTNQETHNFCNNCLQNLFSFEALAPAGGCKGVQLHPPGI